MMSNRNAQRSAQTDSMTRRDSSSVLKQSSRASHAAELRQSNYPASHDVVAAHDDDGRTIADMSMLDGFAPDQQSTSSRDVREELGDPDSRRALIFGATWAGLSIGLVYVVVFGIVIALMVLFWN